MAQNVLSVFQVNEYIRSSMENDLFLSAVAVRGEISNYKKYPSGHHYFTLKDENASLRCVMFRGNAMSLRFAPENGMKIIAFGKISAYPRDGVYQLYCSALLVDGTGDLYTAFEQLKKKLANLGLFDESHKKPLPKYPHVVGIVTSSAGAAIHDMLKIIRRRYPIAKVLLLPVRVQGVEAPGEISAAIQYANKHQLCDVLIVGRGGGSIEDLWAFNDERVAYAIYQSEIPVISAVGHEPDVTISDYVADVRAATPTHAAEIAVPDQNVLRQQLDSAFSALSVSAMQKIHFLEDRLHSIKSAAVMQAPTAYITMKEKELDVISNRIHVGLVNQLHKKENAYASVVSKLDAMSPLKVLSRGYIMAQTKHGEILKNVDQAQCGDEINILLQDGILKAEIKEKENGYGTEPFF